MNKIVKKNIKLILFFTLILPLTLGLLINNFGDIKFISLPLHSVLEASGGVIALILAGLFFLVDIDKQSFTVYHWSAIALLFMGIFDIFHASVPLGKTFIWLHSIAVFTGGIFFPLVWINDFKIKKFYWGVLVVSFLIATIIAISSIVFQEYVPAMLINGEFTFTANILNLIGGIGFFIAGIRFILKYKNEAILEDLFLAGHAFLFGVAGILFFISELWDMEWWFWHSLRLIAYLVSLIYMFKAYIDSRDKLKKYVDIINKNVIISSTNKKGIITNVSEAFSQISGYSKDELIGKSHNIVRHPDMPKELYKEIWKTIKSGENWLGEIKNIKKNREFYWVSVSISPTFGDSGIVNGYTAIRQDITDKKRIEEIAITDALTKLYNRGHFNNIFKREINRTKRDKKYFSFLIIDIDHFKQYNDTYGHQAGDDVLIKFAKSLKTSISRASDFAFRLGGEEFGMIFSDLNEEDSLEFASIVKENIEKLEIEHSKNSASKFITASMGLVVQNAKEIKSDDEIYKLADEALYEAKESGRNKVILYTKEKF